MSEKKSETFEFTEAPYTREEYLNHNTQAHKDLQLVMNQTGFDQESAIKALLNNSGDIVNAIMDLTFFHP